jgi:hypothetical protein
MWTALSCAEGSACPQRAQPFRSRPGRAAPGPSGLPAGNRIVQELDLHRIELAAAAFVPLGVDLHPNGTTSLCILGGTDVLYVACVPSPRLLSVSISVGTRFPAWATSLGRVLLAALSEPELQAYIDPVRLQRFTERSIGSVDQLRAEIETARIKAMESRSHQPALKGFRRLPEKAAAAIVEFVTGFWSITPGGSASPSPANCGACAPYGAVTTACCLPSISKSTPCPSTASNTAPMCTNRAEASLTLRPVQSQQVGDGPG